MIVVASVRPGRIGLPIAQWVREQAERRNIFDIDFADLAEINLPFMDEPNHPRLKQYTKQHTIDWSERVAAADAFVFVTPEYNHSYTAPLKNALDFLSQEWWRKPAGFVSYGGVSGGSRGVSAFEPAMTTVGLIKTGAAVEIPFAGSLVVDGRFTPNDKFTAILDNMFTELDTLATALKPLR
ncbi:MAG: NAD(P)H-dependent oxidoreductase [Glaciihabitans sp.]|nr:NAD(P)H-dependent oxidoreductase [Glaciihabitans sp.]